MNKDERNKLVYVILKTVRNKAGGYIPCIVEEGTTGFSKTDWNLGPDITITKECVMDMNKQMGYTAEQVERIVLDSMFPNRNK